MRSLALLLGASAALAAVPAPAAAFKCTRHTAAVKVTTGTLTDQSTGQPVSNSIDDKGFYELSKDGSAVITIDKATAKITGSHGGKAVFQLSCYQYHSEKVQPLIKGFSGTVRVRAPKSDAKKIGVSMPEGLVNMVTAKRTDFTVSRPEGVHHKRTTIRVAKGAGTVLVGAFTNLTHHSPCTPGRELVIEPSGRIHSG